MDVARLRASWRSAEALGDSVPEFFYATLFVANPGLRELFPTSMAAQRDRLFAALGHIVPNVDDSDTLQPYLRQLGADHRRFAVRPEDYPAVGGALLATLAYFLGEAWTDDLAADWTQAYQVVASLMQSGADAASGRPAVWNADVISHRRVAPDVAVIDISPHEPYPYRAGQSIAVESILRPRVWRYLSPANAPRADGSIELHVRAVRGGEFSPALVHSLTAQDILHLGSPVGTDLLLDSRSDRPLLLVAGGTGLAPLKALVHELSITAQGRATTLILGARSQRDLYDLPTLERFAEAHRWLRIVPVVSEDPWYTGAKGTVVEALDRAGYVSNHDIYVCGGPSMVNAVNEWLLTAGIPPGQVHIERFGASRPRSSEPAPARFDYSQAIPSQAIPDEARIR